MSQKLQMTKALLDSAANAKEILELEPVRNNWIAIFNKSTGSQDGDKKYVAEQILFMNAITANQKMQEVDKASLYGAWIELSISGLTLRDGLTYIVPFKGKAQFMVGWKGRLEQINEMPNVVYTHEPQVVYTCDDFEYEKGPILRIIKHKAGERTEEDKITHVYMAIDFQHATRVYLMEAPEVLSIRDRYSESYKYYKKQGGKWANGSPMDPPMWITDEAQAFKKTLVKRVYNNLPKLAKHKMLDEKQIKMAGNEHDDAEDLVEKTKGGDITNEDLTEYELIDGEDQQEQNNTTSQQTQQNELANNGGNQAAATKPVQPAKNASGKKSKDKKAEQQPDNQNNNETDNIPVDDGF